MSESKPTVEPGRRDPILKALTRLEIIATQSRKGDSRAAYLIALDDVRAELASLGPAQEAEGQEHDSCSHWREGDSDNCVWCGDDLGPTTVQDVVGPDSSPAQSGVDELLACPFAVGDRIRMKDSLWPPARVTEITERGFKYEYDHPMLISPRIGTTDGGECYQAGFHFWEKAAAPSSIDAETQE